MGLRRGEVGFFWMVSVMTKILALVALMMVVAVSGCNRANPERDAAQRETATAAPKPAAPDRTVKNPYPTASEVRLFVEIDYTKDGKMVFNKPEGRLLSANEQTQFERALVVTKAPEEVAACFIPHHFFRYYDRQGKQVGEVEVCFCCTGVRASGASDIAIGFNQILSADFGQLKKLVHALGEPTDVQC